MQPSGPRPAAAARAPGTIASDLVLTGSRARFCSF
jgi:hypothetical protein